MCRVSFNVHRVVKIRYLPGFESDWHTHDFYHAIYVLSGMGMIKISDTEYIVQDDEFYLIPPGVYHLIAACNGFEFRTIEVKFILDAEDVAKELNSLPRKVKITDSKIRYLLESILVEAAKKEPFFHYVINVKFGDTALRILRTHSQTVTRREDLSEDISGYVEAEDKEFSNVVKFIEENIDRHLRLQELARVANQSKAYFCTLFKRKFGTTPMQYVRGLKLLKAKDLLLYSDLNVTQVAHSLGFTSLHYFSRFFKKAEGISPYKYLRKMKDDIRIDIKNGE
jgi:AraC-like DNA-binding protein